MSDVLLELKTPLHFATDLGGTPYSEAGYLNAAEERVYPPSRRMHMEPVAYGFPLDEGEVLLVHGTEAKPEDAAIYAAWYAISRGVAVTTTIGGRAMTISGYRPALDTDGRPYDGPSFVPLPRDSALASDDELTRYSTQVQGGHVLLRGGEISQVIGLARAALVALEANPSAPAANA